MPRPIPSPAEITDIVWLQTSFLGDVILTTAPIALAAAAFPEKRQHLITTEIGCAALSGQPMLKSVHAFKKNKNGLRRSFQDVQASLAKALPPSAKAVLLKPHLSARSALLAHYLALPTITFNEAALSFLAAARVPRVAVWHEAQRISLLLTQLGLSREDSMSARLHLDLMPPEPSSANAKLFADLNSFKGKLVGVAPGSVWATKRWTQEGFTELCQMLTRDPAIGLVLIGSDKERPLCEAIQGSIEPQVLPRVWNIAGETSLGDLNWLYAQLDLVVTNDSSPVHYASAFNVPTVAIFGATVPEMGFSPLAPHSQSLGVSLECRPCSDHGPSVCPLGHFKCMRDIKADIVYKACRKILEN